MNNPHGDLSGLCDENPPTYRVQGPRTSKTRRPLESYMAHHLFMQDPNRMPPDTCYYCGQGEEKWWHDPKSRAYR